MIHKNSAINIINSVDYERFFSLTQKRASKGIKIFSEAKFSDLLKEVYKPYGLSKNPSDYIFVSARALTEGVPNENLDAFPEQELLSLKKDGVFTYETFILTPLLKEHDDSNIHKIAGGFMVDTYYEDHNPKDKCVINLIAVDKVKIPKFASDLLNGKVKTFSMGCLAGYTVCSKCGHTAHYEWDYCPHIKNKLFTRKAYEKCFDVYFRELSRVANPADVNAQSEQTCFLDNEHIVCK